MSPIFGPYNTLGARRCLEKKHFMRLNSSLRNTKDVREKRNIDLAEAKSTSISGIQRSEADRFRRRVFSQERNLINRAKLWGRDPVLLRRRRPNKRGACKGWQWEGWVAHQQGKDCQEAQSMIFLSSIGSLYWSTERQGGKGLSMLTRGIRIDEESSLPDIL